MKHFTKLLSTLKEKQMQEGYSKCRDKPLRKKNEQIITGANWGAIGWFNSGYIRQYQEF